MREGQEREIEKYKTTYSSIQFFGLTLSIGWSIMLVIIIVTFCNFITFIINVI